MSNTVHKYADDIFNVLPIDDDVKKDAYDDFIRIAKKGQGSTKKNAIIVLCVHNAMVRRGYFTSMDKICAILCVKSEHMKVARKYFRDNRLTIEHESIKSLLKTYFEKVNVVPVDIDAIALSLTEIKYKSDALDRVMLKSLAAAAIYVSMKDVIDKSVFCDEMNICKTTLDNVLREMRNVEFIK